jgi:hypothetical protein
MQPEEIKSLIDRNSPFYQRINLPHGLTTTDLPGSWYQDNAWDNAIDAVSIEDAARYRPQPKWKHLQNLIPPLEGKTILEIGSNCGFFTFEFAKHAERAIGLDVSKDWHKKSLLLKSIKQCTKSEFYLCDFMLLDDLDSLKNEDRLDFFSPTGTTISIKPNIVDIAFCSTVIDHVYFPFLFIYKMLMCARSCAIIDTPIIDSWKPGDCYGHNQFMHIDGPEDGCHHGFSATKSFWSYYLKRLNVNENIVAFTQYSQNNLCIVVNTSLWQPSHLGC